MIGKRSEQYLDLQRGVCQGWRTWNPRSVLSYVNMPGGFAATLCLKAGTYLRDTYITVNRPHLVKPEGEIGDHNYLYYDPINRPETVRPILSGDDGRYQEVSLVWDGTDLLVQSAQDGDDLAVLVTVRKPHSRTSRLIVESGMLWNRPGAISRDGDVIHAQCAGRRIDLRTTAQTVEDFTITSNAPYLAIALHGEIGVYTGRSRTLEEVKSFIATKRAAALAQAAHYGDLAETFTAMHAALTFNTIYDPENNRAISPVSRLWASFDGGFVMFDWDTYFAAYMFSMFNKEMAYANAVEITKSITSGGFIPNVAGTYGKTSKHSQPPVGSFVVREIYRRYNEKWFLEEVYDELLSWNRWWPKARDWDGYLCWGAEEGIADARHGWKQACYESGLDNAPMYDGVPFSLDKHMLTFADTGLMGMYVWDCRALADIARILGRAGDADELESRAASYETTLQRLWSDADGIFLNKRLDTGEFCKRLSPVNFYPLLDGMPSAAQGGAMINHYFDPQEFHGEFILPSIARNDPAFADMHYWRGRIWGPMNLLAYLGLRKYRDTPRGDEACRDFAARSRALLLQSWRDTGSIYENYNALTGHGDDDRWSDSFYHWGALLGFISFIENGDVPAPGGV